MPWPSVSNPYKFQNEIKSQPLVIPKEPDIGDDFRDLLSKMIEKDVKLRFHWG